MMETRKFVTTIWILCCICEVFAYPPRPLNERSPDLTWQAWLLVDDQNQNKQQSNSDGMLRRRITPKSVFIAPTFSPESFPACADGYSSDPMGRCVKIIKLDQDAHYEFLIEKLKEKFSSLDYEDEEEEEVVEPTTGPLQFNIPLNFGGDDSRSEESGQETDMAIIVSPTTAGFDFKTFNFDKRDNFDDEVKQEVLLKKLGEATTKTQREATDVTPQVLNSTTSSNTTATATTPTYDTTTDDPVSISSTTEYPITSTMSPTTTDADASTIIPTETETETISTTTDSTFAAPTLPVTDSTTNIVSTQSPKPDSSSLIEDQLHSMKFNLTTRPPRSGYVRFPDSEPPVRHSFKVKFPDANTPAQHQIPSSLDHITNMNENIHHQNEKPVIVNSRDAFQNNAPHDGFDRKRNNEDNNHKSLFMIPPRWNPSSFQKPLVLRFSRKHAFMDKNQFNYPNYYRSIPPDDFEYLFKFKNRQ